MLRILLLSWVFLRLRINSFLCCLIGHIGYQKAIGSIMIHSLSRFSSEAISWASDRFYLNYHINSQISCKTGYRTFLWRQKVRVIYIVLNKQICLIRIRDLRKKSIVSISTYNSKKGISYLAYIYKLFVVSVFPFWFSL